MELAVVTEQDTKADLGTSYHFSLGIQLGVVSDLSALSVLISGTDSLSSTSSIHICPPTITSMQSEQVRLLIFSRKLSNRNRNRS